MKKVRIYTNQGMYVTTVLIPEIIAGDPEVIIWGSRIFLKNGNGHYIEKTFIMSAVKEEPEDGATNINVMN